MVLKQFNYDEALEFLECYSNMEFDDGYEKTYFWLVSEPKIKGEAVDTWDIFIGKDLWEHNWSIATKGINDCKEFLEENKKKFLEAFITTEQDYWAVRRHLEIKYPYGD
ncbi:MAG: hypothetical protein BZ138_08090 [Methanosphaera sp. rholeuAM270]|nr:MAG: hypothetical protein BZ138_08090 [Methanosphaera sp. rholeuAM270]